MHLQREALGILAQRPFHPDFADSGRTGQHVLERLVEIAVQTGVRTDTRHFRRINLIGFHTVHAKSLQVALLVQKAQSVTVGKRLDSGHDDTFSTDVFHRPHFFTQRFGRMERKNIRCTAIQKITGESAVETFLQTGCERQRDLPR